jgi:phosphoglycerol transferase MdoB-like AlkP superfamily enzyme
MLARRRIVLPHAIAAALTATLLVGWRWWTHDWLSFFRPLPVIVLAVLFVALFQLRRLRGHPARQHQAALAAMLAVLSLLLLGKIFFYTRIIHYGCWLAMPATMLLLIAVFGWIPACIKRIGAATPIFLAGAVAIWVIVLLSHLTMTATQNKRLTVSVGGDGDQFWAETDRGIVVNNALAAIEQIIPPRKTLACFPEGIMLNYLARRRAPTPYVNYNPPDLLLFAEDNMLSALQSAPPDYILIVHKDTSEFGVPFFGRDYGQNLFAWIIGHYQPLPLPGISLGAQPLRSEHFGIRLLVRRH